MIVMMKNDFLFLVLQKMLLKKKKVK